MDRGPTLLPMQRWRGTEIVGPIEQEVAAQPALVYQMLSAIGQGTQRPGEGAEILERSGDQLVADFRTLVPLPFGRVRSVRTREEVQLRPPDRIDYEHLDGPVRGLRESITVEDIGDRRCRLAYRGSYRPHGLGRRLVFRLLSRGSIERTMEHHFADLRTRAEARAKRSRVFPAPHSDQGTPAGPSATATHAK